MNIGLNESVWVSFTYESSQTSISTTIYLVKAIGTISSEP